MMQLCAPCLLSPLRSFACAQPTAAACALSPRAALRCIALRCIVLWCRLGEVIEEAEAKDGELDELRKKQRQVGAHAPWWPA